MKTGSREPGKNPASECVTCGAELEKDEYELCEDCKRELDIDEIARRRHPRGTNPEWH